MTDELRERDPQYVNGWIEGYQNAIADAKHPYTGEPPSPDTDIDPDDGWSEGHRHGWLRAFVDMESGALGRVDGDERDLDQPPSDADEAIEPEVWRLPADEPEPAAVVIVIGSFGWENGDAVRGALHNWWRDHGQPPVHMITSGCPHGAELVAREMAEGFGWSVVTMRDEDLAQVTTGAVFAFITDYSKGAEAALDGLYPLLWKHVYREETRRHLSPWTNR